MCDLLDEEQRELQQPAVLERARHLFGRITHGRYRLDIARAGEGEPAFRAVETARARVLPLDQLSGGTRLQLLFAVRLAFLEMQEGQWKLPIVLDETLGNSDEARAEQIIDAAIEICRQGRQVFYLTAQHDEVSKWRRRLRNCPDVRWKHVDLAEVRNFSAVERVPIVDYQAPPPVEVVPPDGQDWLGYGKLLGVPMLDGDARPEELHLWYVVDDVQLLYRLLNQDINLWGQLRELVSLARCRRTVANSRPVRRRCGVPRPAPDCWRPSCATGGSAEENRSTEPSSKGPAPSMSGSCRRSRNWPKNVHRMPAKSSRHLRKGKSPDSCSATARNCSSTWPNTSIWMKTNRYPSTPYGSGHEWRACAAIDGGLIDLFTIDVLINLVCGREAIGARKGSDSASVTVKGPRCGGAAL